MKDFNTEDHSSTRPLISFIITTYNLPTSLLSECINSILALSLNEHEREIILVDDGSAVSPLEGLKDLQNNILFIRQTNKGLSAARNTGLKLSTGSYIQFVDGDDSLIRIPYEHCLDIIRYKEADLVLFDLTSQQEGNLPDTFNEPCSGTSYMQNNNIHASACGYIFRRAILGKLRFREDILMHEDEDFTPQLMLRAETVYKTDARAYYYRKRSGSITTKSTPEHVQKRLTNMENVIYHLRSLLDTIPQSCKPALNRRIAQLTMDYLYNIIVLTRKKNTLDNAIQRLEEHGLYPLPDKKYTKKYVYFRKMINNRVLRNLLILTLPK